MKLRAITDGLIAFHDRIRRCGWAGAACAVMLGLVLLCPALTWIPAINYDVLSILTPPIRRSDDAVIVFMNEKSYAALHQVNWKPWDRGLHAQFIEKLLQYDVKAIGFDILLDAPGSEPDKDEALAQAIKNAGKKIVLAAILAPAPLGHHGVERGLIRPSNALGADNISGVVDFGAGPFGVVRTLPEFGKSHPEHVSFARKLFDAADPTRSVPEPLETAWLRCYDSIPEMSYVDVLSNSVSPEELNGKVVLVGRGNLITTVGRSEAELTALNTGAGPNAPTEDTSGLASDFLRTPRFWVMGRSMPGVELQATAFLNLYHGTWLTRRPIIEFCLVIGWGLTFGRKLSTINLRRAATAALITLPLLLFLAVILAVLFGFVFPWLVATLQVFCALAFAHIAPKRARFDVFISYRRECAGGHALWLKGELARHNIQCFLDTEGLAPGSRFWPALLDAIREADVFVLLVSEGTLDRCWVENDVMTEEIVHAYQREKRIIPLLLNGFSVGEYPFRSPPASVLNASLSYKLRNELPEAVTRLRRLEGIPLDERMAEATVVRLIRAIV